MSQSSPTEEFGPYLVYEQLGVGGMAQVHRAISASPEFPGPVALKRMLSHIATSEDMVKSFVREARLASYLRHPNVAQTFDIGRVGDVYFIVMELITGRNLREVLRHCAATTGPMPVPIALNILNQVCDALDYAHNLCNEHGQPLNIIHRDVSPSNVIVADSGVTKLIDFGIAKASGPDLQTMSGTLKGKFAYMAPEYIAGRLDARADLFAVGVIAHELLTNRPLFSGRDDIDTLTRVRDMPIAPPSRRNPQVPPEIDDVIMTALARDPDGRWQHATALRSALTTLTERLGLVATNQQVVDWLDWAFAQQPIKAARASLARAARAIDAGDTDDEPATLDEPSISIEPRTSEGARTQITAFTNAVPEPPGVTPTGTPAFVPAQSSRPLEIAAAAAVAQVNATPSSGVPAAIGSERSYRHARPPRTTADASAAVAVPAAVRVSGSAAVPMPVGVGGVIRPSGSRPVRVPSGLLASHPPPPVVELPPAVELPPLAIARTHSPSGGYPVVARGSGTSPLPLVPSFNPAPFAAPRPSSPTLPPPYDPARSELLRREFEQRVAPWPAAPAPARNRSATTVAWLVLAAAIAAITIYFVLPLLI